MFDIKLPDEVDEELLDDIWHCFYDWLEENEEKLGNNMEKHYSIFIDGVEKYSSNNRSYIVKKFHELWLQRRMEDSLIVLYDNWNSCEI